MFRSLCGALIILCTASSAAAQVRLGISAPFSGPLGFLGKEIADGATLAANAINAKGGVRGKQLELIYVDDACLPDRAANQARKLIGEDKVEALIGYPCQQTALAVSRTAAEANRLLIALAPPTVAVQSALHVVAGDAQLGTMVGDLLAARYSGKRIGLRVSDSNLAFVQALNRVLERRSIRPTDRESVPPNTASAPNWISSVDVAVIGPGVAPLAAVSGFARQNPNVAVVSPIGFFRDTGTDYPPNLIVVANPTAEVFPAAAEALKQAQALNMSTSGHFIYAYAALQIFASTATRAGAPDFGAKQLLSAARREPIPTVIGTIRYNEAGENIASRFVLLTKEANQKSPFASIDVCKSDQCSKYEQCPRDCPK